MLVVDYLYAFCVSNVTARGVGREAESITGTALSGFSVGYIGAPAV
jgi:hypothetical protein